MFESRLVGLAVEANHIRVMVDAICMLGGSTDEDTFPLLLHFIFNEKHTLDHGLESGLELFLIIMFPRIRYILCSCTDPPFCLYCYLRKSAFHVLRNSEVYRLLVWTIARSRVTLTLILSNVPGFH